MSAQGGADQRFKEVRWSCGEIRRSYEVLSVSTRVEICNSAKRAFGKFHGKKDAGLSAARPPFAAQASKYHSNHVRGLIFQRTRVAKIENIIVAKRPDHSDPLP